MELKEKIINIPKKPGVYLMKNRDNEIIYIGKAKDLNKRVSSYFQKKINQKKTEALISHTSTVETIITDNEIEALILESNLIRKHKPRFNIELKDNNKYPYIKITPEKYQRIVKTRIKKDDSALYFGPYPNVKYINRTIKTIIDIFPIRRCSRSLSSKKNISPCINYYLGKCLCPIQGKTDIGEYNELVEQVILFLKGQNTQLLTQIKREMEKEAQNRKFEKAIQLRERYTALKTLLEDQKITTGRGENEDIFGIANINENFNVTVLIKREGKIIGKSDYTIKNRTGEEDVLEQFLDLYYEESRQPPETILLPFVKEELGTIKNYLKHKYRKTISIIAPKKGLKKRLVELACKNAYQRLKEDLYQYNPPDALLMLKKILKLPHVPEYIEGFDTATILGNFSVASMVRFQNGVPDKKNYRRFRIKYIGEQNDVEMIKEAVARRYQRLLNTEKILPDLILVDGGKPQLNGAVEILHNLSLLKIPVIGLAKKNEDIYTYGKKRPIKLEKGNDALRLLMAIRNEAHRFANTYHVKIRTKEGVISKLKNIPRVGEILINKILSSPISFDKNISIENLKKINGIGDKIARQIYKAMRKNNSPASDEKSEITLDK
ncbi:UvrABC system protein C [subsurface metagenome]